MLFYINCIQVGRVMLLCGVEVESIIVTTLQLIYGDYTCQFLHVRQDAWHKQSHLLPYHIDGWIVNMTTLNNECCHIVTNLLYQWDWKVLEQPPYSHDMSPCDFDLFPNLKELLWGFQFSSVLQAVGRLCRCHQHTLPTELYGFKTFSKR